MHATSASVTHRIAVLLLLVLPVPAAGRRLPAPPGLSPRPQQVCGPTDNRGLSYDDATARIVYQKIPFCSAFIVDYAPADNPQNRCMLSAGHCVPDDGIEPLTVELEPVPFTNPSTCAIGLVPPEQQWKPGSGLRENFGFDSGEDWWVFKPSANATTGRTVFQEAGTALALAASLPPVGAPVAKRGYGTLGALSTTGFDAGCVCEPGSLFSLASWKQTEGSGAMLSLGGGLEGNYVEHSAHSCPGDSGGPVLRSGAAVAIHTFGSCGANGPINGGSATTNPDLREAVLQLCPLVGGSDDYVCYKAKDLVNPPQNPDVVGVEDQFETAEFNPKKADRLCAPSRPAGGSFADDVTHLKRYPLGRESGAAPIETVDVSDRFGTVRLRTKSTWELLVPTAKSHVSQPAPLDPPSPGYEYYKCYAVKRLSPFEDVEIGVADQFGTRTLLVKKPVRLCAPASVDGSDVRNPRRHLLCYAVRPGLDAPTVFVNNAFGPETLELKKEEELCVPAFKTHVAD